MAFSLTQPIAQGICNGFSNLETPRGAGKVLLLPAAKRPECCGGLPPRPPQLSGRFAAGKNSTLPAPRGASKKHCNFPAQFVA